MKLIVAVAKNWGIGKDNKLLFSIPSDMKFFRETTKGNTVVMGRKTLESFPGGKPLKNRRNIVFSKKNIIGDGYETVSDTDSLFKIIDKTAENIFVIGGESIYKLLLPYVDTAFVTKVDTFAEADSYMINLDENPSWYLAEESEEYFENGLKFKFCTYKIKDK